MTLGNVGRMGGGFVPFAKTVEAAPPAPNFDPVDYFGTDLIEYWDAQRNDTLTTLTDSTYTNVVSSWLGLKLGSNLTMSTPGLKPTYLPEGLDFGGGVKRPCLDFDGTAQYLTCTDSALLAALPATNVPSEMWMLLKQEALAADTGERYAGGWCGSSVITGRTISRIVTTGVNRARGRTGIGASATSVDGTAVDFSGIHVIRHIVGATQSSLSVDGGSLITASAVPSTTNTRFRAGAIPAAGASNYWKGKIAAIFVTKPLTTDQATALHAYLG